MSRVGVLDHLINLISLDLGHNRIVELEPRLLAATSKLQIVKLDSNLVRKLFVGFPEIKSPQRNAFPIFLMIIGIANPILKFILK